MPPSQCTLVSHEGKGSRLQKFDAEDMKQGIYIDLSEEEALTNTSKRKSILTTNSAVAKRRPAKDGKKGKQAQAPDELQQNIEQTCAETESQTVDVAKESFSRKPTILSQKRSRKKCDGEDLLPGKENITSSVLEEKSLDIIDPAAESKVSKRNMNPGVRIVGGRIYDSDRGQTCHQEKFISPGTTIADTKAAEMKETASQKFKSVPQSSRNKEKDVDKLQHSSGAAGTGGTGGVSQILVSGKASSASAANGHHVSVPLSSLAEGEVKKERSIIKETKLSYSSAAERGPEHKKNVKLSKQEEEGTAVRESLSSAQNGRPGDTIQDKTCCHKDHHLSQTSGRQDKGPREASKEALDVLPGSKEHQVSQPREGDQEGGCSRIVKEIDSAEEESRGGDLLEQSDQSDLADDAGADSEDQSTPSEGQSESECEDEDTRAPPASPESPYTKIARRRLLPQGTTLTTVMGVDFAPELVGDVLQLVEFLHVFAKLLDMKAGQAANILRELERGATVRRGLQSPLVQLNVKLLTFLCDAGFIEGKVTSANSGKESWLQVLSKYLANHWCPPQKWSQPSSQALDLDPEADGAKSPEGSPQRSDPQSPGGSGEERRSKSAEKLEDDGNDGAEKLLVPEASDDVSTVAKALAAGVPFRAAMEETAAEDKEKRKEVREEAAAARKEAREQRASEATNFLKQALDPGHLLSLTLEEQRELMMKCRGKAKVAIEKKAQPPPVPVTEMGCRSDAVRVVPTCADSDGNLFWKLYGVAQYSTIVLQGTGVDMVTGEVRGDEAWSSFSSELESEVVPYFAACQASKRIERKRKRTAAPPPSSSLFPSLNLVTTGTTA
eukprot:jgi/Mesen1/3403/ME000192S02568